MDCVSLPSGLSVVVPAYVPWAVRNCRRCNDNEREEKHENGEIKYSQLEFTIMRLYDALICKYPKNAKIAEKWTIATGTPFEWGSLSKPNMSKYAEFLCSDMAQSSARQYLAKMKAVIEPYTDEVEMPKDWRKFLTVKDDESQHTYLTEDEIKRIIEYRPEGMTEAIVQQQFILGCLTGARHSDYSRFTEANISPNGNLVYVSKKTHIKAELPLSQIAKNILFAKDGQYAGAYKREVCDTTFNETIRRICFLCDIDQEIQLYRNGAFWTGEKYKAVSSHTARRSFATCLYLRCRDLVLVSKLCGHSSPEMTSRYISCGMESLTDQAMGFFRVF